MASIRGQSPYNELANDGRTTATRSTGQIEEGPVGYSIATIDGGVVSWRFKALDDPCPFVVITSPADHRLMRHPGHAIDGSCEVRALVFGARPIKSVACLVEDTWTPMSPAPGERVWTASVSIPPGRLAAVTVRAIDETGRPGQHTILAPTQAFVPPVRERNGSDAASIGVWAENGIMGTQLGPNRNGEPFLV
jgi:3',5'-cyclic-AMP phosphodiesterase